MRNAASFGTWLKQRRKLLDLTQAELAARVGCATVTIRKFEADALRPSRSLAELLAKALELSDADVAIFLRAARSGVVPEAGRGTPTAGASDAALLPIPPTELIGRAHVVAAVAALLLQPHVRLLTLTGPGGVGKTRLALQVALTVRDSFRNGAMFVALAPIRDPGLVLPEIAHALGVPESGAQSLLRTVQVALRDRHLLLILDNCEQVLAAAVEIAELLHTVPGLTVLATSRAPLHLSGEHEFAVPPLDLPEPAQPDVVNQVLQSAAGALFVTRAQAVKHDFEVTTANAAAIGAMCTRLDGLPLAIELAAIRSKVFPPQVLLTRLEHRLDLLTGGARDLAPRQQTLRATLDWSYNLLAPAEQRLFARLAVFAGGWTIAAAAEVCSLADGPQPDITAGVHELLDQSLVQLHGAAMATADAEPRFMMLETMRDYAHELLEASGEQEIIARRHAMFYLTLAEAAAAMLVGPEQRVALAQLSAELDNLRAALTWALRQGAAVSGVRLAVALHRFWIIRGALSEGRRWLEAFLAYDDLPPLPAELRADAQLAAGDLARWQIDSRAAIPLLQSALRWYEAAGNHYGAARALHALGWATWLAGDTRQSVTQFDASLARYRALGDARGIAMVLLPRAFLTAHWDGQFARALQMAEESLQLFRTVGDLRGIAMALRHVAIRLGDRGQLEQSAVYMAEALDLARALGDTLGILDTVSSSALLARLMGDFERSQRLLEEQVALAREIGHIPNMSEALADLGLTARYQGNLALAQRRLDEAMQLEQPALLPNNTAAFRQYLAALAFDQGNLERAGALYRASLVIFRELAATLGCVEGIEGLAAVVSAAGDPVRAVQLWSSAAALRDALGAPLPRIDHPRRDVALAQLRAALGAGAFESAWASGQTLSLDQAVAVALDEPETERVAARR